MPNRGKRENEKVGEPYDGIFELKGSDFVLKEYECLRKEVELLIQESRSLERNIVLVVGAIWTWLFTAKVQMRWPYWIPCLFTALGAVRAYGIDHAFGQIGEFVARIEDAFLNKKSPLGWEHFETKGVTDSLGQLIFWVILNASTFTIAIARWRGILEAPK